jgi:hypothetical protein
MSAKKTSVAASQCAAIISKAVNSTYKQTYSVVRVTGFVFEKIAQNVAQSIFRKKIVRNFYREKRSPKIRATSVIIKKLPKVNNHPIGENSPNLVTLSVVHT